jgi:hypothetical protein
MLVKNPALLVAAAGLLALVHAAAGRASSITLNCTQYQNSLVPAGCTTGATPMTLPTPGAYAYSDTSLLPDTSTGGIITGSMYPTTPPPAYAGASFYDAFIIHIGDSLGDSISSTINLGSSFAINGFEERLYTYTGTAPIVGPVSGAMDFWTAPQGSSGTVAVLPQTLLPQGDYVLEIRGDVTGTSGGSYSGTLQLSPVPVPASGWLLITALCGLGALAHRRRPSRVQPTLAWSHK